MEPQTLEPQTYCVTGANRGLGLELCRQLTASGARVIATARDPEAASELRQLPVRLERLDVEDPESVAALAAALEGEGIDVLVNNAGRGSAGEGIATLDFDDVARNFSTNSLGPLRVVQALLPNLRAGSRRCIAHMSSRMGSIADNLQGGYYGYRASKAALNMLNRTLALELAGQGFVCVLLHPGWVRTELGGKEAPLAPPESVQGLLRVLSRLRPADNGRFLDYTGAELPW